MADTLFVRLHADGVEWVEFDGYGRELTAGAGSDETCREQYGGFAGDVVVIVPGEDVLLTSASVPSRQHRQIVQAVPYVVEEELATDVEHCFFAIGPHLADGSVAVAVVSEQRLVDWLHRIEALGLVATVVVPENELVCGGADGATIVIDGDRVHTGSPAHRGLTTGLAELPLVMSLLEQAVSATIHVHADDRPALERPLSEIEASGLTTEVIESDVSGFRQLVSLFDATRTNLLQGRYKVEVERSPASTVWRSVALLAGVTFVLHILMLTGQGWYLASRAAHYEDQARALYQSVFPQERNVRDIRRRWNAHLGRSTGGETGQFLELFALSSRGLGPAGLTLENVNFNESRGDLIMQVIGPRSETLVQYAQQLAGQGLNAEIGTISQQDNSVRGSIKVKAAGA